MLGFRKSWDHKEFICENWLAKTVLKEDFDPIAIGLLAYPGPFEGFEEAQMSGPRDINLSGSEVRPTGA